MKKSIWVSRNCWSPALSKLSDFADTTSDGRQFHLFMTLSEKKWSRMSLANWRLFSLNWWPLVRRSVLNSKNSRSARFRRSSSDHRPNAWRRSAYVNCLSSLNNYSLRAKWYAKVLWLFKVNSSSFALRRRSVYSDANSTQLNSTSSCRHVHSVNNCHLSMNVWPSWLSL